VGKSSVEQQENQMAAALILAKAKWEIHINSLSQTTTHYSSSGSFIVFLTTLCSPCCPWILYLFASACQVLGLQVYTPHRLSTRSQNEAKWKTKAHSGSGDTEYRIQMNACKSSSHSINKYTNLKQTKISTRNTK
jgi:hypothetical protein